MKQNNLAGIVGFTCRWSFWCIAYTIKWNVSYGYVFFQVEFSADTLRLNLIDLARTGSKLIQVAGRLEYTCPTGDPQDPVTFTTRDSHLVSNKPYLSFNIPAHKHYVDYFDLKYVTINGGIKISLITDFLVIRTNPTTAKRH